MNGIYWTLSIMGMLIIVAWYVQNDGRAHTTGLLAMKDAPEDEQSTRPSKNRPR